MHQVVLILLLASVEAREVITSVIDPPYGFKGDLQTFVERMNCEFSCEEYEDEDGSEMFWLWRDESDCGIVCSTPDALGPNRPDNASDSARPGTPERPVNDGSDRPTNDASDRPANDASDRLENDASDRPANDASDRPANDASDHPANDASDVRQTMLSNRRYVRTSGKRNVRPS